MDSRGRTGLLGESEGYKCDQTESSQRVLQKKERKTDGANSERTGDEVGRRSGRKQTRWTPPERALNIYTCILNEYHIL